MVVAVGGSTKSPPAPLRTALADAPEQIDRVDAVAPDQWDDESLPGWTVADLVAHLVTEQLWVPPLLAGEPYLEGRFPEDTTDLLGTTETDMTLYFRSGTGPGLSGKTFDLLTIMRRPMNTRYAAPIHLMISKTVRESRGFPSFFVSPRDTNRRPCSSRSPTTIPTVPSAAV